MKSAVYLDAVVLAGPSVQAGLSSFSDYINNLISWTELRQADWIDVYISRDAAISLAKANAYPPYPELRKTISSLGITHIQAEDIFKLINGFLLKSRVIEDELMIDDLLFDDIKIEPTINYKNRQDPFPYHFELLTILLFLHRRFLVEYQNQILITSLDVGYTGSIIVDALVNELITKSSEVIPDHIPKPIPISVQLLLCICMHSLHLSVDPCNVWSNARCESALHKSIELFVYQNQPQQSPYSCPISHAPFRIGTRFIDSCKRLGFSDDPFKIKKLLRACSETILNENTCATHWIRTNQGANSPPLKRGTDTAWRRDIDHEYHLHYWSTTSGPELACVVPHNDFSIPMD